MDCEFGSSFLVSRRLCPLRCDLWFVGNSIGLMMWMWISAIVVLLGAQLNSEIEHQTARDSTVAGERPLGERGAAVADSVGKAA